MLSFRNKRNQVIGILVATAIGTGISAPQANAFNLFSTLAASFGFGDLYTSASGLYASGSALYDDIAKLTISVPSVAGALGIQDPSKLYTEIVNVYSAAAVDPKNPEDINSIAQRVKAAVAAKVGSASLTQQGQAKAVDLAQQNANLAAAANTAADDAQSSISSLDAIQKNTLTLNGLAQMVPGLSTQLLQLNQTAAANTQIASQAGNELAKSNIQKDFERREVNNRINAAGNFVQPLFVVVP